MKPRLLILVLTLSTAFAATAQQSSQLGIDNPEPHTLRMLTDLPPLQRDLIAGCRHLTLDIDATGFFYDAEYATPMAKGYTVAGFRLSPALAYGINERAQLRIGFNATAFAGLDSLYLLRPTLSLVYAPTKWLTLVAGTIYGSHTHRLDAPVYDPSRWIFNYQEDGLQILTKTKIWNSDTWLDWQHYLTPWTPDQERFTAGTNHIISLFRFVKSDSSHSFAKPIAGPCIIERYTKDRIWAVDIPAHFIASHRGGELKTIDTNTVTTFNEKIGLRLSFMRGRNMRPSRSWTLDLPVYFYHLEDNTLDHGGKAFYPTLSFDYRNYAHSLGIGWSARAAVGYWHGDHYFSAHGSPAFWSANAYSAQHIPQSTSLASTSDIRNLLTFSAAYEHEFEGLNLGLQADICYDLDLRKTDLFVGFYMRFKERFLIF